MAHLPHEQFDLWRTLSSINVRMYIKDAEGKFVFINQACADDLRLKDPSEAIDKTDYHFFTTSLGEKNNAVAAGYLDESSPIPFNVPNTQVSGATAIFRMMSPSIGVFRMMLSITRRPR